MPVNQSTRSRREVNLGFHLWPSIVRIEVTQDDIDASCPEEMYGRLKYCALARAICRTFHINNDRVSVCGTFVMIWHGRYGFHSKNFHLPRIAIDFIDAFDDGREIRPFGFDWEVDDRLVRRALTAAKVRGIS